MIDAEWHSGRFWAAPQSGTKCHTWKCVPQARCLDRAKGNRGPVRAPGHGWRYVFPGRTRRACHGRGRASASPGRPVRGLAPGICPQGPGEPPSGPRGLFCTGPVGGRMASRRTRRFVFYIKDRGHRFGFRNPRSHESGRPGPPPSERGTLSGGPRTSGRRRRSVSAPDGADGGGLKKKKRNRYTYVSVRAAGPVTGRPIRSESGFRSATLVLMRRRPGGFGHVCRVSPSVARGCFCIAAGLIVRGRVTGL